MTELNLNNSTLRICIDRVAHRAVGGRVFSRRMAQPVSFDGLSSLSFALEQLFDEQELPQAFQCVRTFIREEKSENIGISPAQEGMSEETMSAQRGEIATLEVLVRSRRSSTWQGTVDWLDGSEVQEFSGYLELLHLIDQRVSGRSF